MMMDGATRRPAVKSRCRGWGGTTFAPHPVVRGVLLANFQESVLT